MTTPNQRQQNQLHALRQAMGLPLHRTVNDAIAFSIGKMMDLQYGVELARYAAEVQKDCIHVGFAHAGAKRPGGYAVVYRELCEVNIFRRCLPYAASEDAPVVLVSVNEKEQFCIDARGSLQRIPGLPEQLGAGNRRALFRMRRIVATMGDASIPGCGLLETDAAVLAEAGPRNPVICMR